MILVQCLFPFYPGFPVDQHFLHLNPKRITTTDNNALPREKHTSFLISGDILGTAEFLPSYM
jgi:hypothetical protein